MRKRGENFLITLTKDIQKGLIDEYKTKLTILHPLRISVEKILEEIIQCDEHDEKDGKNEKFSMNSIIDIERWRQFTILHTPVFSKEIKTLTSEEKQEFSEFIFKTSSLFINEKASDELKSK